MFGLLAKERIIAAPGYNRWRVPIASILIHTSASALCMPGVFTTLHLTRIDGVVTSAGDDWSLSEVVWVFTVAIVFLGLAAAFAGKWLEQVGPRMVGVVSACCWGGGYLVGAAGIMTHQLWLLYLGYGVIGGCGLGLGYVSPVSTLIRWFPDRRGMAAGMAIMGFGGGAMIGTPMKEYFIRLFYRAPEYLGTQSQVELVTEAGRRFAEVGGVLREVVIVGATEARDMTLPGPEGVYVVGSGATGVAEAFILIGLIYLAVMLIAAFSYRLPPQGWQPDGWQAPDEDARNKLITTANVDIDQALRTPQFYQLWIVLCLNVTAGIGVLGVARTMITEIFGTTLPQTVDTAFAATYVVMISAFNMVGRFIWASASDYLGRRNTYWIFFLLGIALYLSVPFTAQQVSASPSMIWLVYFYAATMIIFTMYGGGFATIPAYLADIFGTRYVGGIHGRLLTAWSTAGVLGPLAITSLRQNSVTRAINDLVATIDPQRFAEHFGAPLTQLDALVAQNSVTIARLMEIAPPGTSDPTSGLYNSTMILMALLLAIALVSNALMKPVDPRHHIKEEPA